MDRRHFLLTLPSLALWPPAAAQRGGARLKITDIRMVSLRKLRDVGSLEPAWNPGGTMAFEVGGGSYIEVHTDQGLVGIGPPIDSALLPAIKGQLAGKDPFDMEQHVARLRYYTGGVGYRAGTALDLALWDLIGKACGQPLYKLWGGAKDKVVPYASMIQLSTPEERARMASRLSEEGWRAIKLRLHYPILREDIRAVEAVRKAVGDRMEIMVDANQAQSTGDWQPGVLWDFRRAVDTARELQRLNCYWLEEPLPRFAFDRLAELNRLVEIPIAGGENCRGVHEFRWMIEQGVYDILQPEVLLVEGATGLRKIGVLAQLFGKRVVPHAGGRSIGTIAHLHLVASWPHAPFLEMLHDPPIGSYEHGFSIFQEPPRVDREGYLQAPQRPGLGVEINRDLIAG